MDRNPSTRRLPMIRAAAMPPGCRLAMALLVLASLASTARAESPWSFRLGGSRSYLSGELGQIYPRPALAGTAGVAWRTGTGSWRLRTGLTAASREGAGDVPVRGILPDGGSGGPLIGTIGTLDETWSTSWLELPLQVEWAAGPRRWRPYVSAGPGIAWRLAEHANHSLEVPTGAARRFEPTGAIARGLETKHEERALRAELGFGHGLHALYDHDRGPQGAWGAWTLVLDIGL